MIKQNIFKHYKISSNMQKRMRCVFFVFGPILDSIPQSLNNLNELLFYN